MTDEPAVTAPGSATSSMRAPTLPPACAPPRPPYASVPAWYLRSDGAFRC